MHIRSILKHRFLILCLLVLTGALAVGAGVVVACSNLIIYSRGDGSYLVCQYERQFRLADEGPTYCVYECTVR